MTIVDHPSPLLLFVIRCTTMGSTYDPSHVQTRTNDNATGFGTKLENEFAPSKAIHQ